MDIFVLDIEGTERRRNEEGMTWDGIGTDIHMYARGGRLVRGGRRNKEGGDHLAR